MFRANAFKHTYSIRPRDAAERIYMATLRAARDASHFPAREHAKLRLARLLPARLRDPMTRDAMDPQPHTVPRTMSDDRTGTPAAAG